MLPPHDLRAAIMTENLVALTKVPGIGRKGAQKMVIELKDKVNALGAIPDLSITAPRASAMSGASRSPRAWSPWAACRPRTPRPPSRAWLRCGTPTPTGASVNSCARP